MKYTRAVSGLTREADHTRLVRAISFNRQPEMKHLFHTPLQAPHDCVQPSTAGGFIGGQEILRGLKLVSGSPYAGIIFDI